MRQQFYVYEFMSGKFWGTEGYNQIRAQSEECKVIVDIEVSS